jgi:hypothetical protein
MFKGEHVTMNAVCLHPRWLGRWVGR